MNTKILVYLPIFFIFTVCASVSADRESPFVNSGIDEVQPDWQEAAEGAYYYHGKIESVNEDSQEILRLEFYALRIDLSHPGLEIAVYGGSYSKKVSSFVRDNSLIAGINALPFDIITIHEGRPIKNSGLVISEGVLLSPAHPRYDALVFYSGGGAAIVSQSSIQSAENIENAVGGFYQILLDGQPAQRTLSLEARHPRSAAGISANGRYLFLLVIDGRRAGSAGSTEKETAFLLRSLGALQGINFDGGGSSALAMRFPDGRVRVVNTPVQGGVHGLERAVAGSLGIRN